MKVGAMLGDLVRSLFRRPATRRYPAERAPVPERVRGVLRFHPEQCTGCALCVKDCPANALWLFTIDEGTERFVLRYDVARCALCGQCVLSCHHGALELAGGRWELAATHKDAFTMLLGDEADVRSVAGGPAADAARPASA
jgi:formate hydrogenlyase subunit 6/NADH:ubiquinone oxidoreductase subunit I